MLIFPFRTANYLGDEMFDVVCCHAVLEWLADPEETVEHLARFLRPEGCLSLMFNTATPRY